MKFSDIIKKGFGIPAPTDLIDGGVGIDVQGKKAYSKASDGTIFSLGLNTSEVAALISGSIALPPIGSIIMFSGLIINIPSNWAVCDGTSGTPDLRNRFPLGTDSTTGSTGGYADQINVTHTHTTVAHNHTGATAEDGAHDHTYTDSIFSTGGTAYFGGSVAWGNTVVSKTTAVQAAHTHTVTIDNKTVIVNNAGESGTNKNFPPYIKLVFIMRK